MYLYPDHEMARLQELEEEAREIELWLRNNPYADLQAIREQRRRFLEKQTLINNILNNKFHQDDTTTKNN